MSETPFQLATSPIVEAVLELRCDFPPGFDLATLEADARAAFREFYDTFKRQTYQQQRFEKRGAEPPTISAEEGVKGLQFSRDENRQLVQVTTQGFSFHRLAPYTSLDDYLPEIERAWTLFNGFAKPALIREIRLRYINRLLLPLHNEKLELDDYLKVSPHLPDETRLEFIGFFNQHTASDLVTGHEVNIVMSTQPAEGEQAPLIFDIDTLANEKIETTDWERIISIVQELRALKNHVFRNTLTDKCLNLYTPSDES